ncbi:sulfotransferase domain-containing protein [Psychroserpens burtonensis]|uniref:Sulfotransferase domain-containing protein n=1 Tax=Psychroserpens burtonensis TaxID=49278 RepID=A0A5C7B519_9FLAO|nr:sulfotransferase [Psychroserpens burtonensis]TXE15597.1 sulfotransferase domain-containing protein [Psychroserpens burtonensis]
MQKSKYFPNLFIPGAAKSGTSTLHALLNFHEDICMSSAKEPFYIVKDDFDTSIDFYNNKYSEILKEKPNAKYRGDASTSYMLFPKFIERVKAHLDEDVKFIFILRNPVDRLYSHYWYLKGLGMESLELKDAILNDIDIEPDNSKRQPSGRFKSYFQYGLYGKWLSRFYDNFDSKNIKVVFFEDLKSNQLGVVNECLEFLNLSKFDSINKTKANKTVILKNPKRYNTITKLMSNSIRILKPIHFFIPRHLKTSIKNKIKNFAINKSKTNTDYPKLSNEERQWITELYKKDFILLQSILNKNFSVWNDFKKYL